MHLNEMAHRAWQTAKEKGLHANLDGVTSLGAREQALLTLIPITLSLNEVIQTIKKQGISTQVWDTTLVDLERTLLHRIDDAFYTLLSLCAKTAPALPVEAGDRSPATAIRLLLVGTEVCEAQELLAPATVYETHHWRQALSLELSDILIRVGDIAHGLQMDLDACTEAVMDANNTRAYGYGTPLEHTHG